MESGGSYGVRVDPQRGSAKLSRGVSYLLRGVKPPDPSPSNTALPFIPRKFIFVVHVDLYNLQVKFVYQGHRVKVKLKVT